VTYVHPRMKCRCGKEVAVHPVSNRVSCHDDRRTGRLCKAAGKVLKGKSDGSPT